MNPEATIDTQKVIIKRLFAAPVDKLYKAWTDPAIMEKWFSPNERWVKPIVDMNPVIDGRRNVTMVHSDGDKLRHDGKFVELVPDERIVFTWTGLDDAVPSETRVTIELRPTASGTELTLIHEGIPTVADAEGFTAGWEGCLDMLARFLDGTHSFA